MFLQFSTNSRSLLPFLGLNKLENEFLKLRTVLGCEPARGYSPRGAAAYHVQWPDSRMGFGLPGRPTG
jgi:hypothetical protein